MVLRAVLDILSIPYSDATVYHIAVEVLLLLVVIKLLFFSKKQPAPTKIKKLTKKEEDELIDEWVPEPLVKGRTEDYTEPPVIESAVGTTLVIGSETKLNFGTLNFLGLLEDKSIQAKATAAISKYGVGSCGPRGFYGTVDVHMDLEAALAKFLGVEEVIMYSYGFSTVASAIPAYSKRGDIIFYDEKVNFAIQRGLIASRSTLRKFKHNDVDDLERLLKEQSAEDEKNPQKARATRRFVVVEGLYTNTGTICPLKRLIELKFQYQVRLIVEESMSFGTLGKNGRGLTELLNLPIEDIDIMIGSLETSLGSIGGFCAGRSYVIDHQRLSGQGYCFSASLPPLLAIAASCGLERMNQDSELFVRLHKNVQATRAGLASIKGLRVTGDVQSPLMHLVLAEPPRDVHAAEAVLQTVVDRCMELGLALTRAKYVRKEEMHSPEPSIRMTVSARHTDAQIAEAVATLKDVAASVF